MIDLRLALSPGRDCNPESRVVVVSLTQAADCTVGGSNSGMDKKLSSSPETSTPSVTPARFQSNVY